MPLSRTQLLAFGSAAGAFGVPLLSALAAAAQHADPADIDTLQSAIAIERAGINAYAQAVASGLLAPPVLLLVARFVADHTAHRDALTGAVRSAGRTPSEAVAPFVVPPLTNQRDVLAFANAIELKAASTYLSAIPDFRDRELAGVAASILGVETMHVALLAEALDTRVYPSGFVA